MKKTENRFRFTAKQIEAHKAVSENYFTLYGGAIRGGKTFFGLLEMFYLCMEYPNSRALVMRADMPRFTATTLRAFNEVLNMGLDSYLVRWNKGTNVVVWRFIHPITQKPYTSEFIFMAESYQTDKDLHRFHGLEFNFAFLDEGNELQEVTYDKIVERCGSWFYAKPSIRTALPCPQKILMTCNPNRDWIKGKVYEKWKDGTLPKGTAYIPAKITDNPYVPKSYLENLASHYSPVKYRKFVEGDWDVTEKTGKEWCYAFDYGKHTDEVHYIRNVPIHVSFDFNNMPYTTMLCCQIVEDGGYITFRFFKEYTLAPPYSRADCCLQSLKTEYIDTLGYNTMTVYGDASGRHGYDGFYHIFEWLKPYKHAQSDQVLKKNPNLITARDLINTIFEEKKYKIRIVIDREECPNLIKDLDELQNAPDGFDKKKVDGVETVGHCYSAMVYLVCKVYFPLLKENANP